jgi:cytochrome oxidase assembly protein ShyY1
MLGSRSRRPVVVLAVAVVVAASCVALGLWQLRRLEDRRMLNATILDRRSATPLRIEGATSGSPVDPYRRAVAEGTYDVEREVLVYGRSLNGQAGHQVVTPLVLADGGAVLVVRGWVPFALETAPVPEAAPAATEVEVSGSLVPAEGDGSSAPDADGVVRALDVEGIAPTLPYEVFPLPLLLARQTPPQTAPLPAPMPPPDLSEGPHLSYAIQWFSFAVIASIGAGVLLRRDRRTATGGL